MLMCPGLTTFTDKYINPFIAVEFVFLRSIFARF